MILQWELHTVELLIKEKTLFYFPNLFFLVKFIIFQDSISMKYDDKKRDDSDVHNIEKTITLRGRFKKTNNFEVANCKHVDRCFFLNEEVR